MDLLAVVVLVGEVTPLGREVLYVGYIYCPGSVRQGSWGYRTRLSPQSCLESPSLWASMEDLGGRLAYCV